MKEYYNLLAEEQKVKYEIKEEKIRLHNKFMQTHEKQIRVLDVLIILMIVFNYCAVFITHALVEKNAVELNQTVQYIEVNPVQAKVHDLNTYTEEERSEIVEYINKMAKPIIFQAIIWLLLLLVYLYHRSYVFTEEGFYILRAVVAIYFLFLTLDFVNDLGYFVGAMLFR